ncbi:hypothetical protein R3P38DRAFT_2838254 [Favolaschia claudopus]|uniref:Secreted protein n=1 Tax=Favolaschia claudopus TaxID=2862362 RepID=A0AAW0E7Q7_9AGAR
MRMRWRMFLLHLQLRWLRGCGTPLVRFMGGMHWMMVMKLLELETRKTRTQMSHRRMGCPGFSTTYLWLPLPDSK